MTRSIQKRQRKLRKKPFNQGPGGSPKYWPRWLKAKEKHKVDTDDRLVKEAD
jgi:hypothetical protein